MHSPFRADVNQLRRYGNSPTSTPARVDIILVGILSYTVQDSHQVVMAVRCTITDIDGGGLARGERTAAE